MALENEEIQRMMEEAATKVQGLGTSAGSAAEQQKKAALAQAEFTANLQKSVRGLTQMGRSLSQGGSSFQVLGESISGLTGIISGVAKNFGIFGKAFAGMADGVGAAAKLVTDQLDQLSKNYGALGEAGATAADGITGMQRQFEQMGNLSLPAFAKAINENAQGMAAFGGTVASGAEQFSKLAGDLTTGQVGERFLKLGMTFDQVGESAARYAANTARFGGLQNITQKQLIASSQKYLEEMDLLSRMTGATRREQEQEQLKSLADVRFRARIMEMEANGQKEAAEEMRKTAAGLKGPMADAFRASVTGITLTDEAAEANLLTGDTIRQAGINIQQGSNSIAETAKIMRGANEGVKRFSTNMSLGGDTFGGAAIQAMDYAAIVRKAEERATKDNISFDEAVRLEQEKLLNSTDKNTDAMVKSQTAAADAAKNMQILNTTIALYATPAIEKFAQGLKKATDYINEKFGIPTSTGPGRTGAQAEEGRRVVGSQEARTKAESYLGRKIDDAEFSALIKATHAEAAGGKQASQQEQAMIMASILNRARDKKASVVDVLGEKNQFQSVTGTAFKRGPSQQFLEGPGKDRLQSIEGATDYLDKISREQKNFTAASSGAYGLGTNIGYRNRMIASGGTQIGGSIFNTSLDPSAVAPTNQNRTTQTGPADTYRNTLNGADPSTSLQPNKEVSTGNTKSEQQNTLLSAMVQQLTVLNERVDTLTRVSNEQLSVQTKTLRQAT
jgi:hypothetical protein